MCRANAIRFPQRLAPPERAAFLVADVCFSKKSVVHVPVKLGKKKQEKEICRALPRADYYSTALKLLVTDNRHCCILNSCFSGALGCNRSEIKSF